jgi:hypothetical protein
MSQVPIAAVVRGRAAPTVVSARLAQPGDYTIDVGLRSGAYQALRSVLSKLSPEEVPKRCDARASPAAAAAPRSEAATGPRLPMVRRIMRSRLLNVRS